METFEERMIAKYPDNFRECFDFCIGEGWEPIVEKLIGMVVAVKPDIKIVQIKEKFGGLRFYVDSANKDVNYLIECAEEASERTCEVCGKEGKIVGKNWLQCLCPEHGGYDE